MTQARTSSTEFDISASGATSAKLVRRGPDGPAASATAWVATACRWVRRNPATPAPGVPKANRISGANPGTAAAGNPGVTEIVEIKGRGHALVIDIGWRKVADTALAFVQRFAS
jgi:hypothetical protein